MTECSAGLSMKGWASHARRGACGWEQFPRKRSGSDQVQVDRHALFETTTETARRLRTVQPHAVSGMLLFSPLTFLVHLIGSSTSLWGHRFAHIPYDTGYIYTMVTEMEADKPRDI